MNTRRELDPELQHKVDWMIEELTGEFGSAFERSRIEEVVDDSVTRLLDTASVRQFVPLMAYRFTRERLLALVRTGKDAAGDHVDIVFVSLSGGGRGQIAAALTAMLCGDRVTVHSAGTHAGSVDPAVRTVIAELGVNPDEAFARPVTNEVLRAADVIVTMGHSVGMINLPAGVRHEDWRIGDPIGAPVDETRRVRDDIEYRVRHLLADLGIIQPEEAEPATAGQPAGVDRSELASS